MELEIKNYSKLYLRRTLRSIFPQEKHVYESIPRSERFVDFEMCYNYSMKLFSIGKGENIASWFFAKHVIFEFLRDRKINHDQLTMIYKCIILFFPEKVEDRILMFLKEAYKYNNTSTFTEFTNCIVSKKITGKNFLDYLKKIKLRGDLYYPHVVYDLTSSFVKYFEELAH